MKNTKDKYKLINDIKGEEKYKNIRNTINKPRDSLDIVNIMRAVERVLVEEARDGG
mgnify:CR=1 FL=1